MVMPSTDNLEASTLSEATVAEHQDHGSASCSYGHRASNDGSADSNDDYGGSYGTVVRKPKDTESMATTA